MQRHFIGWRSNGCRVRSADRADSEALKHQRWVKFRRIAWLIIRRIVGVLVVRAFIATRVTDDDVEVVVCLHIPVGQHDLSGELIYPQVLVSRLHGVKSVTPIERSLFDEELRCIVKPDFFLAIWPSGDFRKAILGHEVLLDSLRGDCQL